jgi:tRNA(Arg) A34 adenosine deaminase TadA
MKINRYVEIAKANIHKIEKQEKHFSFIMQGSKILSIGMNNPNEHPKAYKYGYKFGDIHSELSAILKYGEEDCSDVYMINIRINRFGNVRNSKPCKTCQNVLKMFRFKKIFYSTTDSNIASILKI